VAEDEGVSSLVEDSQAIVLVDVEDRIAVITLNRPERRNALNGPLIGALDQAVQAVSVRDDVKVVILTGAAAEGASGGFCSGGDTKDGGHIPGRERSEARPADALEGDLSRYDIQAAMLLHTMAKPTIAMVGGPAVGAGLALAAACDLRFCSEDAVFWSNFSASGLSGDYGGSFFLTRIIGTARARELYLLNDRLSAAEALSWGLVSRVLPAAELHAFTMGVARTLLRTPATVLALMKDNLNEAEDEPERRRMLFASELANQAQSTVDIAHRLRRKAEGAGS
jgi:2-(1,2-epoxy-1,2-dihydrophenyl)acetyl-CoA isomerase